MEVKARSVHKRITVYKQGWARLVRSRFSCLNTVTESVTAMPHLSRAQWHCHNDAGYDCTRSKYERDRHFDSSAASPVLGVVDATHSLEPSASLFDRLTCSVIARGEVSYTT
jgi:hypothetical protein